MKIDELYRHTHNENEMREQHKKKMIKECSRYQKKYLIAK